MKRRGEIKIFQRRKFICVLRFSAKQTKPKFEWAFYLFFYLGNSNEQYNYYYFLLIGMGNRIKQCHAIGFYFGLRNWLKTKTVDYQQSVNKIFSFLWKIIWKSYISGYDSLENKPLACIFKRRSSRKHLVQGAAKCPQIIPIFIFLKDNGKMSSSRRIHSQDQKMIKTLTTYFPPPQKKKNR